MAQHTTEVKVNGIPLVVEWDIDVDSPVIESIWVEDSAGDDIACLLDKQIIRGIKRNLELEMDKISREVKAWQGQYNNV